MDLQAHHDLIYGEEFCFPATATYYPALYAPTGINVPAKLYEHRTNLGCDNQGLHYPGHQAERTSCMYYVVPDYGISHPPHGPHPFHPYAIANGRFVRGQESRADTVERTYHQPVPTSHAVLPSAADRTPASTAQSLAHTNGLFVPSGLGQTVAVAPEMGVAWNPSLQSSTVSSTKFQDHTVLPKVQRRSGPSKRGGTMVPTKPPHARQASQQSLQVAVPFVKPSVQTNLLHNDHVSYVGSDLCKMVPAGSSQPSSKTRSYASQTPSSLSQKHLGKAKKPIASLSSEIIVKSYTSSLHVGNPEGKIIIRTDQYNRDDLRVVYSNAKFFVIKSLVEADVHKSIKYGVWSSSSVGNQKLDSAFRGAQSIAASTSALCPVFLFFSVNGSYHFCGVAEMVGPVDFEKDMDFWSQDRWVGSFPVRWHIIKNLPNPMFRSILLQNNECRPVTSSRDTQEIYYTPGTTMLKMFKYARAEECLLDEFLMHEEEEARNSQCKMFKLRRGAPHYIPASMHARRTYNTQVPKSDSVLMDRIIRETDNLADELQDLNLERHQGPCQEFGNLTSEATTTDAQKGSHCYGKEAHENIVKASNVKAALDGEQQYWKKVEITPSGTLHPETAASVLSKAPEYPVEGENGLVHGTSGAPEMTCEEQKIIGKPCSLAINSQACSNVLGDVIAIGSMLVPIITSN